MLRLCVRVRDSIQTKQGDIVTQIPAAGRNRRIVIGPRPPPELDGSPRTKAGSGRPAVISDFVEILIERTFVAKLCSVAEDLAPVGSMEIRLLQYVDATGNAFTTRYAKRTHMCACLHMCFTASSNCQVYPDSPKVKLRTIPKIVSALGRDVNSKS
eukprot:COSAG06_NODE_18559_length_881_cov_1.436061_1_plen_156_part_00